MASTTLKLSTLLTIVISLTTTINLQLSTAGDPDILSDFILPPNTPSPPDPSFFTFTAFRSLLQPSNLTTYNTLKASAAEFPALNGQSVSLAALRFPPGTTSPPHARPRSAGLMLLLAGTLEVGFVDTSGRLFDRKLRAGDMFVFPKGLVHFQCNGGGEAAFALAAFGSADAGTVSVPETLFGTGIDDEVLAESFKTGVDTIRALKAGLANAEH
ncbi:unnamed protein product [Linum trigynum]|uniref:Germin-like protein n=1 Tax=Linum trigynum TaxID=586398 RepID=A0AAV2FZX9_9ROSI